MTETWTIDSVREALGAKKVSARELVGEFYARIESKNSALNAYLTLAQERARRQTDRIDSLIAEGKPLPPLAGVPVAIKDVISTQGVKTTCGSKILENYFPPFDATAVERLEEAFRLVAESYQTLVHLAVIHDQRLGEHNEANARAESRLDALIDAQMRLTADIASVNGHFDKVTGALEALVSAQARTDELFRLMLGRNGSAAAAKAKVKKEKKKEGAKAKGK